MAGNGASRDPASTNGTAKPAPAAGQPVPPDAVLGHVVWLMMNMPVYRHVFLSDLEWMVMPPILLGQYRIFRAAGRVVGFAAWAYLSETAEARLQEPAPRLAPADWKSGDRLWLVNVFAAQGFAEAMLTELRQTALAGRSFKMHQADTSGKRIIVEVRHA